MNWPFTVSDEQPEIPRGLHTEEVTGSIPVSPTAFDQFNLHELVDGLEPEQEEELRDHALRLVKPPPGRFKVLRAFDGPDTKLGARAREIVRTRCGRGDADC